MTELTERAIAWEHSGDGEFPYHAEVDGRTLTVRVNDFPAEPLYTLMADGTELADLDDWPSSWRRPPVPQHLLDLVARPITTDLLWTWARRICDVTTEHAAEVAALLGLPAPTQDDFGRLFVQPAPPGTAWLRLFMNDSAVGGLGLASVEVRFTTPSLSRSELDACFGPSENLPRVHWDAPHVTAHRITTPDAPLTCTLFASFHDDPGPTDRAFQISLRRDSH
ncbi:hypothetical protein [Dactylosporangium matsuzakiense]|uniref:Uncharacterized protein n=1 Tax=Dactylosporangium matsuzakiense TaxID=53360 RepID=A0A9W6KPV0_9ACTN|nr:hypothetical protein [Dactylosporangium matsuzakiense]UWZ42012.1 hypothetical protein Dmats_30920 [Dactylosporangium matsuzakiense]GLL04905.1 hypothetical protein GCM10017581_066520 [Dactylosporangium matsuzakiense]